MYAVFSFRTSAFLARWYVAALVCTHTYLVSFWIYLVVIVLFTAPFYQLRDQHPTSPSRRHVVFTVAQRCPPHPFLHKWLQVILAITISLHCPCTERLLLIQVQGRSYTMCCSTSCPWLCVRSGSSPRPIQPQAHRPPYLLKAHHPDTWWAYESNHALIWILLYLKHTHVLPKCPTCFKCSLLRWPLFSLTLLYVRYVFINLQTKQTEYDLAEEININARLDVWLFLGSWSVSWGHAPILIRRDASCIEKIK
jgi:hypothetical protein